MLIKNLSVTYRQNDNYKDIYDGKMANCCQKVSQFVCSVIIVYIVFTLSGESREHRIFCYCLSCDSTAILELSVVSLND